MAPASRPDEFYRAYLLGFMGWLGVALGSMAILMIRHLTGGGWGMVIRRMLGAAMRTLPLLTLLFIPHHSRDAPTLHLGACRLNHIADNRIFASICEDITKTYLTTNGFILRAVFYFAIWNLLSFLLTQWSKQTDRPAARDNTPRFKAVSGPGLILYAFHHFVCGDRLGHVARPELGLDHLRAAYSYRRSARRPVLRRGRGADSVQLQAHVGNC